MIYNLVYHHLVYFRQYHKNEALNYVDTMLNKVLVKFLKSKVHSPSNQQNIRDFE